MQQQKLDQLRDEIIAQKVCAALATQATQLVMGEGNPNADIVFIGEAPGKKEDELGLPFVGASGRFLNEMLESVGLARADTYITNIVKYRPPNNRDPSADEKAAFAPYLARQLQIIQPRVVVTLGRHSMNYFLPNAVIGEVHGHTHTVEFKGLTLEVVPLYHPAAALYNGSLRQTLLEDFKQVAMIV